MAVTIKLPTILRKFAGNEPRVQAEGSTLAEVLKDLDLHGVMPHCHSVTDFWLFEDSFFDIAMDIFCYCYQTEAERKELYRSELRRVLKPDGIYLLSVPAACQVVEIERERRRVGRPSKAEPYRAFVIAAREMFPQALLASSLSAPGDFAGAHVDASARMEDGVAIEPGAVIGPRAEIGSGSVIGANTVIGAERSFIST